MVDIKNVSISAEILKNEDLKEYMRILLDLEKNIRIQDEAINKLNDNIRTLGISENIEVPQKEKVYFSDAVLEYGPIVGIICGIIMAIIIFFQRMVWDYNIFMWIWNFVSSAFWALLWGALVAVGTGIVIGLIIAIFVFSHRKSKVNEKYQYDMQIYYSALEYDKNRVKAETIEKHFIQDKIAILKQKRSETSNLLHEMYGYGILHRDYHNITAVASIYGYLEKGMCRTLEFDSLTGDKGAYNIYENESKLNKIITNEEKIIKELIKIKENQRELYYAMLSVEESVNKMISGVNRTAQMLTETNSQLNRLNGNTEVEVYNQQQTARELSYMNFMNDLTRRY